MFVKLSIRSNEGYSAEGAVEHTKTMTVGQLREMLTEYGDDTPIVTYDIFNYRGASWGVIVDVEEYDGGRDDEW